MAAERAPPTAWRPAVDRATTNPETLILSGRTKRPQVAASKGLQATILEPSERMVGKILKVVRSCRTTLLPRKMKNLWVWYLEKTLTNFELSANLRSQNHAVGCFVVGKFSWTWVLPVMGGSLNFSRTAGSFSGQNQNPRTRANKGI